MKKFGATLLVVNIACALLNISFGNYAVALLNAAAASSLGFMLTRI